jgi:general stress protein 26
MKELRELLEEFDTVMLITRTPEGLLRARPMAVQDPEPKATLAGKAASEELNPPKEL